METAYQKLKQTRVIKVQEVTLNDRLGLLDPEKGNKVTYDQVIRIEHERTPDEKFVYISIIDKQFGVRSLEFFYDDLIDIVR